MIDEKIGTLLVDLVTPMALEVALVVQQELQSRIDEADALRRKWVERAQYEVELARRRYLRVDPENRLVADSLEAEWNEKLRALTEAQQEYERQRQAECAVIDDQKRAQILALATDFPRLWRDPETPDRERKRMVRLLVEDVTLLKSAEITLHVRLRGGVTQTLSLPIPSPAWKVRQTNPEVISEIDRLLDQHTYAEIATILTERGFRSGERRPITARRVWWIRQQYGLKSRYERLREAGLLTRSEIATLLNVCEDTVKKWRRRGWLRAHAYSDKNDCLFEPPGENAPVRRKRKVSAVKVASNLTEGVQCEA